MLNIAAIHDHLPSLLAVFHHVQFFCEQVVVAIVMTWSV